MTNNRLREERWEFRPPFNRQASLNRLAVTWKASYNRQWAVSILQKHENPGIYSYQKLLPMTPRLFRTIYQCRSGKVMHCYTLIYNKAFTVVHMYLKTLKSKNLIIHAATVCYVISINWPGFELELLTGRQASSQIQTVIYKFKYGSRRDCH